MFHKTLDKLFNTRKPDFPLNTQPHETCELEMPSTLSFSLVGFNGRTFTATVSAQQEIQAGDPLADDGKGNVLPSPVTGKVVAITRAPDLRGSRDASAVLVEPASDTSPNAFPALDAESEPVATIMDRIREAGVVTDAVKPRPLLDLVGPDAGVETLVILAADREPLVCAAIQLLTERASDTAAAASMLGRISGAGKLKLAVPDSWEDRMSGIGLETLGIPAVYPETLEPMVALRAGKGVKVIALETALAALDAVRKGKVQDRKTLTVIGPDRTVKGNYRVPIGMRLSDLFSQLKLEMGEEDKIVAGGPMRGFAQYSLDSAVDAGVDAITHIAAKDVVPWSEDPCVNCGGCIDACPVNLQVHLIGRYAEFGLFDRAEDLGVFHCIECGLCAALCSGRRPLVQLIQLAKKELKLRKAALEREEP